MVLDEAVAAQIEARERLVRDETGAALAPAKARACVAMLRRAAETIGTDRVLFVSHSREVQELADARIVMQDEQNREPCSR